MDITKALSLFWPVILIQVALQVYAIVEIVRTKKTRNLSLPIWIAICVVGGLLGTVSYLLFGRSEDIG